MTNYLRSDENVANSEIERASGRDENFKRGIKTAGTLAATAVGAGLSAKVLPFLNEYIPTDLAMKGISKVAPKLGDFLKKGQSMGLNIKEGLDFIKNQMPDQEEKKEKPKENRNIIQQYSPELHEFIDQEVKKGRPAIQVGALAQNDKRFSSIIQKLSNDHKTPWSSIIESIYGNSQQPKSNSQEQLPVYLDYERENSSQNTQPNEQKQGEGQAALMDILNKINQRLG